MIRGYQLSYICSNVDSKIKPYFRGLFNPDTTKNALAMIDPNKPNFLILNTDPSYKDGAHWVSLYVDLQNKCYFLDTFAHHPNYYNLENFCAEATGDDFIMIPTALQSKFTTVCGLYTIFFGHHLCIGKDLDTILSMLKPEKTKVLRDKHIFEWFQETYGHTVNLENNSFIDCKKFKGTADGQKCKDYEKMILDRKTE